MAIDPGSAVICEALLAAGVNVNRKTIYGETAMHLAAKRGRTDVIDVLMKYADRR